MLIASGLLKARRKSKLWL